MSEQSEWVMVPRELTEDMACVIELADGTEKLWADVLAAAPSRPEQVEWWDIGSAPRGALLLYWPAGNGCPAQITIGAAKDHGRWRAPTHWQPLPAGPHTNGEGEL